MLFATGFLITFTFGGLTGFFLAAVPADYHEHGTYFVVAHFHYVLFGGSIMGSSPAVYYWFPKMSGRMMNEKLGRWHFWLVFIGFNGTFIPMHWLGLLGMPRRVAIYDPQFSSGTCCVDLLVRDDLLDAAVPLQPLLSLRSGKIAGPNPWGARTLEWMISSPAPYYNFKKIPAVLAMPYDFGNPLPYIGLDAAAGAEEATPTHVFASGPDPIRAENGSLVAKQGYELGHGHDEQLTRGHLPGDARHAAARVRAVPLLRRRALLVVDLRVHLPADDGPPTWPPIMDGHQLPRLDTAFAAVNSVVLFGSGVTMHFAMEGWKHANKRRAQRLHVADDRFGRRLPRRSGPRVRARADRRLERLDLRRVVLHANRDARLPRFRRRDLPDHPLDAGPRNNVYAIERYFGLTAGTLYWHFVDVIWVALFFLFYLW